MWIINLLCLVMGMKILGGIVWFLFLGCYFNSVLYDVIFLVSKLIWGWYKSLNLLLIKDLCR